MFIVPSQIEELKNDNALLRAQLQQHGVEINGDATPQWLWTRGTCKNSTAVAASSLFSEHCVEKRMSGDEGRVPSDSGPRTPHTAAGNAEGLQTQTASSTYSRGNSSPLKPVGRVTERNARLRAEDLDAAAQSLRRTLLLLLTFSFLAFCSPFISIQTKFLPLFGCDIFTLNSSVCTEKSQTLTLRWQTNAPLTRRSSGPLGALQLSMECVYYTYIKWYI